MAESTQTLDFFDLIRRLVRRTHGGEVYHIGTVSTSSTTLTGSGTVFPSWAADGCVIAAVSGENEVRAASTRDSDTQITLDEAFSANLAASTAYVLVQIESKHEVEELLDYIQDGLNRFYNDNNWIFLRPWKDITTVASYSTGTITISSGVVTGSGTVFPSWSASGEVLVGGTWYVVSTRDSDTQLTLVDTTVDADAGSSYELAQRWYDMPDDFGGFAHDRMFYRPGDATYYPPITITDAGRLMRQFQHAEDYPFRPHLAALRPKTFDATAGQRWQVGFWRMPDSAYQIRYQYRVRPNIITPTNNFTRVSQEHSRTAMAAILAEARGDLDEQVDWDLKYERALQASIRYESEVVAPDTLGQNLDIESAAGHSSRRMVDFPDNVFHDEFTLYLP